MNRPCPRQFRPFRPLVSLAWALSAAALLLLAGPAAKPAFAEPFVQEYLVVEVAETYDMGSVTTFNQPHNPSEPLTVHFAANFAHGGLTASITPLEHPSEDREIAPNRISLKHPGTGIYHQMTQPINVTGPVPPGVFQVDLIFRVNVDFSFPPGEYSGVLTLTVAPN